MADLPSNTVTFLFTDMEGSTRLAGRLGNRWPEVLETHHRLLRDAFADHQGHETGNQGDAFFVVFARGDLAIAAAVAGQRALAAEPWPDGDPVRVRMGLHTATATVRDDQYVGIDVHRAARICAAGHGGQILVSSATRELVAAALPHDVGLRDLGEHGLKDLDAPEHLFEATIADLPEDFPPLRSAAPAAAAAVPSPPNQTIGRAREVAAVGDALRGDARLLTLTGPGGVGKTRLATEGARAVAADFRDGASFVPLADVSIAAEVPIATMHALGIRPNAGESPVDAITRYLASKHLLLVLDNFEQVLPAAAFVGSTLAACPGLRILVTSREPLGLEVERRWPVSPLTVPVAGTPLVEDALASGAADAVVLFAERALAHDPHFAMDDTSLPAVAAICRRLDGLPLAIELAAARCRLLSPTEIADRLDGMLGALGRGPRDAPARQQTLRATVDWSHDLLDLAEQACFARFAVFSGGATVASAEAVTGATLDVLDSLMAKSLLTRTPRARPARLEMLETIREYAGERLAASSDREAICERHYRHFLDFARSHGTPQDLLGVDSRAHLAHLDPEIGNLHAALAWAVERGDAERALAMVTALEAYWEMRDRYVDAMRWTEAALDLPGASAHRALRITALCVRGMGLWALGSTSEAEAEVLREAEVAARELGDPVLLARVLAERSSHASDHSREASDDSRLALAEALADEALACAARAGDDWALARAAWAKAQAASTIADLRERSDRAIALLRAAGNVVQLAHLLATSTYGAVWLGADEDAAYFMDAARVAARDVDNPFTQMFIRCNTGLVALIHGDTDTARIAYRDALRRCRDLGALPFTSDSLRGLAAVAAVDGDRRCAALLFGAASTIREDDAADPVEVRVDAMFFAPARRGLGPDAWDAAALEGRRLGVEGAIAYVLGEPARNPGEVGAPPHEGTRV